VSNNKSRHVKKEKKLFKLLMEKNKFTNDQELADYLYISTSIISQIRNDHFYLSPTNILRIYDKTGLSIEDIRKLAREDV
jgi:transcriptional regulator with XRE-family HTH domain